MPDEDVVDDPVDDDEVPLVDASVVEVPELEDVPEDDVDEEDVVPELDARVVVPLDVVEPPVPATAATVWLGLDCLARLIDN